MESRKMTKRSTEYIFAVLMFSFSRYSNRAADCKRFKIILFVTFAHHKDMRNLARNIIFASLKHSGKCLSFHIAQSAIGISGAGLHFG
jgi:hypothetical protein